jgi:lipid II:glycine glycyltransferase (peptidoglycan interpeptide bridge formation enzyme)
MRPIMDLPPSPFPPDSPTADRWLKNHVFQTEAWAQLKSRSGWRAHRVTVARDGVHQAEVSVLERDLPRTGFRFFYAPRGPRVAETGRPEDVAELFRRVERLARERRAVFLKIDPDVPVSGLGAGDVVHFPREGASSDWITPCLCAAGFRPAPETGGFSGVQPRVVFRLRIDKTEAELLAGMDQKTRYNIRLAERRGVRIRPVSSRADIETFHRILLETGRRDGFLIRPLRYFLDIQETLAPTGHAQFFLAERDEVPRDDVPLAGALALAEGTTAWYAYGASANHGREHMPNHLMQWTLIRWARARGCALYDFRAVPSRAEPGDPLYGLYRFKKGFGATLTEFVGEYDRVYIPWAYTIWVKGWPLFKKARKALLTFLRRRPTEGAAE